MNSDISQTTYPYCIFLYSKYSNNSKNLIDIINNSNLSLTLNIKYICIDNKDIRNRILNSSKIKIKVVPTILNVFNNGIVQLYEGQHAFQYINNAINSITPPPPVMPIGNEIQTEIKKENTKQKIIHQKKSTSQQTNLLDILTDSEPEDEYIPTNKEDISDNTQNSENEIEIIKKPKKGVRISSTNENFDEDYFDDEQPTIIDSNAKTAVRDSASNKYVHDKKDIQSRAQDLAKEREIEEQKLKKNNSSFMNRQL